MNFSSRRPFASLVLLLLLVPALASARALPPLPEGIASFGAAVAGDGLYVYGGHVGRTHHHSIENLSHDFRYLDLEAPEVGWQDLGEVPGRQGLALVPHDGKVCRIGGLDARNHGNAEHEDLHSVTEVACYDPEEEVWTDLPPLPRGRSSHDAVVVGDTIYVVGGWQLRGHGQEAIWHDTMDVLDLSSTAPAWTSVPQPFRRRALAAAAAGGKVYAIGGLGEDRTSRAVAAFDLATQTWTQDLELPEMAKGLKGFGISAFGVGEMVYLAGADGVVHRLSSTDHSWHERLGKLAEPRFFHRLLHHGENLVFVGGASFAGHLRDLEWLHTASLRPGRVSATGDVIDPATVWPGFRGHGDGHLQTADVPLSWPSDAAPAWRVSVPGIGQSSPVVWQEQVFVTSVVGPRKESLVVSSYDLGTGEVRWRRRFEGSQRIEVSEMVSNGAPTPAVDDTGLYVFFETGDVMAFELDGRLRWQRSLTDEYGPFEGNHGIASSPVLTAKAVVVQATHEGPSYYVAIDKWSGHNHWRVERPSKVAWTTPTVVDAVDGQEILTSAGGRVEAIDAASGARLWLHEGVEKNHVPSAIVDRELMIVASSEAGQSLALRRGGPTGAENDPVVWRTDGVASGFGSPLVVGDCVLFVNRAGIVTCVDRATGTSGAQHRLPAATWASPIAVGDHAYFFSKDGVTTVLHHRNGAFEVVAESAIEVEGTVNGVAAVRGALLLRTASELIRVGAVPAPPAPAVPETEATVASAAD